MTNTTVETKGPSTSIGGLIRKGLANMGPLLVLLILEGILLVVSPPYRSPTSHMLLALEVATIGVVAAGQTFVVLTGGIDLSVEAMVSFAGVTAAILIAGTRIAGGQIANGLPSIVAIAIALALGAGIGLFQGMLITLFRMNPLIVTLGFRSMLLGVSLVLTRGAGINILKDGPLTAITGVIRLGDIPIPVPFLIALIVYIVSWFVLKHTKLGRYTLSLIHI